MSLKKQTRLAGLLLAWVISMWLAPGSRAADPLASLDYKLVGNYLKVSPAALAVPKGIAGSVMVEIANADGSAKSPDNPLAQGAYVEATLRGPSFPARRLVGQVNQPLMLPVLNLVGEYQLDNVRLVDASTGQVRMEGLPSSVPVNVFAEILISRVTSRPLTLQEIQDKGIAIDESNFRAVEFEVGFVLDGQTYPIKFPVVSPDFKGSTEIIPAAELQRRLVQAQIINDQLSSRENVTLPPELEQAGLNLVVKGCNFELAEVTEPKLRLSIPPIPALMVIPGNIGYLNQFFSVQIFTENAAPASSGLSVLNLQARLVLPPGADQVPAVSYEQPGDDPLRFARTGPNKIIQESQPIVRPGADGVPGTADDLLRLYPRESGQAEFLVEGLREGLHVMNLELTGDLDGLSSGLIKIKGAAAGSVLVRNPKFSLTFSHPRVVRSGESYEAFVTVLNTSQVEANLVNVTLPKGSVSGATLLSSENVQLGNIRPGGSATARFRLRGERTGQVRFNNLTTGEDSVTGRFRLVMGVDERGVELSPDSIGYPQYVNQLPGDVFYAANRVLGQALSVYSAPILPPGVKRIPWSIIQTRVLELAEAGQRIEYGEPLYRVLPDLALDWQGARVANEGFDQIITATEAGKEWRQALTAAIESDNALDGVARLAERSADLAGRGEAWVIAGSSSGALDLFYNSTSGTAGLETGDLPWSGGYRGTNGSWLVLRPGNGVLRWEIKQAVARADFNVLVLNTNGTGELISWGIDNPPAGSCLTYALGNAARALVLRPSCDGSGTQVIPGVATPVVERDPELLVVRQIRNIQAVRPDPSCYGAAAINYGTLLGVLFSKPMSHSNANVAAAYMLDNGVPAGGVRIQPGGRIALLNLRQGTGAVRPRNLTVTGVSDPRGNTVLTNAIPVTQLITEGVAVNGRVLRADGSPAGNVPVTLTMNDLYRDPFDRCDKVTSSISQVFTDPEGRFTFDFVLAGVPYTISATDTGGLPPEAIDLIVKSYRGGYFDRDRLLLQAASSNVVATLGTTNLAEALRIAETLDRAIWTDRVPYVAGMQGQEIGVALRFRGRGTVVGRVISADGVSPAAQAAVNLFPDSASRELGRGMFADSDGRFQFYGVPLGSFSVQVKTGLGQFRTVAGSLTQVGDTAEMIIQLTAPTVEQVVRTSLRGTVSEADNITPHAGAQVFVRGLHGVMGVTTSSDTGYWEINDIPVGTYQVVAISMDGRRKGERSGVSAVANTVNYANVALQGTAVVAGRVENSSGQPVANALVAGGETLVRTDANGLFTLTGVPLGSRKVDAGLEARFAPNNFPRLGSATLEVLPGVTNYVVVRLKPAGVIVGQVRNANGEPVSGINVAIPVEKGFMWTPVNDNGFFRFINMPPGDYIVSAPAPPVRKPLEDVIAELDADAGQQEIMAALGEAFASFFGVTTSTNLNPGSWGYTSTRVLADGDTASADVRYFPVGTISGVVLNDQSVPIGARVRLTGLGMRENGSPGFVLRGDRDSDPVTGAFEFKNGAMVGDWGIQVASPFYTTVLSTSGRTTDAEPSVTNLVMQFPPRAETHGRLAGVVVYLDGMPVPGVEVTTYFGPGIVNTTDEHGAFDNQMAIPAGAYKVEAFDPATGYRAQVVAQVKAGITNHVEVPLLGLGEMKLQVFQANGLPAPEAFVRLEGSIFREQRDGFTDTNGIFQAGTLVPGWYNVLVRFTTPTATLEKRLGFRVAHNELTSTNLTMGGTGTIRGTFRYLADGSPITGARVAIGRVADVPTDAQGQFQAKGVPLGTYRVIATDPVTGRSGVATVTLATVDQVLTLNLTEQALGELSGQIFQEGKSAPLAGAEVSLNSRDGLAQRRSVTTGPDGSYYFPGVAPGEYYVSVRLPNFNQGALQNFSMPDAAGSLVINLTLPAPERTGDLWVQVLQPDGVTPASNVRITAAAPGGGNADADANGVAVFSGLRLGTVLLRAASLAPSQTYNVAQTSIVLTTSMPSNGIALKLQGVGTITGQVFNSTGLVPVPFASLTLEMLAKLFEGQKRSGIVADAEGKFVIANVPVGGYRLIAESQSLSASTNGVLASHSETNSVRLALGSSGVIMGRIVRANGTTPVPTNYVVLKFNSQSSAAGVSVVQTDLDGRFGFTNVPLGNFTLDVSSLLFNGLISQSGVLETNQQVLDLGDLLLDEALPLITAINPGPNVVGVEVTNTIEITFSEPMLASTVNANTNAIYLRGPTSLVRAAVALLPHPEDNLPRLARLTPYEPLRSLTTYEVAVLAGERRNALGQLIARGPTDLVGRSIPQLFISSFTTRDADPPQLVSISPASGALQVEPASVLRLSFNEPLRNTNIVFEVSGPQGPVPGTTTLSADGRILVFTPNALWLPNRTYSYSVSNLVDLAGNRFTPEPLQASFSTLDTVGPVISLLRLNRSPVAGAEVPMEAVLASPEPGVTVRFFRELDPVAVASSDPYISNVRMPTNGLVRLQAIATDQFGNDGEIRQIEVTVVPNTAPVVSLVRVSPTNNAVSSGKAITFALSAEDDNAITNMTVVGLGGVQFVRTFPDGTLTNLSFTVPVTNLPGSTLQFLAQSTDSLGEKSPEVMLDYVVTDSTRPTLAFLAPAKGTVLNPAQPLDVTVALADNSSEVKLKVQLSGLVSSTLETNVVLTPNVTQTNVVRFSITNAVQNGGSIQIQVTATDLAGNAISEVEGFAVPDITPPALTSTTPEDGATAVSLWISPKWSFNEHIRTLVHSTNLVLLTNDYGQAVSRSLILNSQDITINPVDGLRPGAYYTNILFPGIVDRATNALVDAQGSAVPVEGWVRTFRTAAILTQTPSNNTWVVAGQRFTSRLTYEKGLNATYFSFRVGTNAAVTVQVNQAATNVAAQISIPTNIGPAELNILAANVGNLAGGSILDPIVLEVRSRDVDDDGDGWLNGFEAERGMNAFLADADSDDFDGDNLNNGQERALGTDPARPDSDFDGLNDGEEIVLGTNPLKSDTDEDGLSDSLDPQPLISTSGISFEVASQVTLIEGETSNLVFTVTSPDLPLSAITFGGTNPVPVFVTLGSTTFTNTTTNGVAVGQLQLRPLLLDAGTHTVTLKATALSGTNALSGSTNITVTVLDNPSFPVTRWKDPVNGNFGDATKWTAGVPNPTTPGIIDVPGDYTVTVNADITVGELVLGAAAGTQTLQVSRQITVNGSLQVRNGGLLSMAYTIAGPGSINIASRANWTSGSMLGTGATIISPGAQLVVTSSNWKEIHTRRVYNMGTVVLASTGSMTFGANAVWENSGLIDIQTDFAVHNAVAGWPSASTLNNYGTIRKSAGIGTFQFYATLNNHGAILVDSGTFEAGVGGSSSGTFNLAQGATFRFSGNTHTLTPTARLQGGGSVQFAGGTTTIDGLVEIAGEFNATGGNAVFGKSSRLKPVGLAISGSNGRLEFNGDEEAFISVLNLVGNLRGSGVVHITEALNWSNGMMEGTGVTRVGTNAVFTFGGTQYKSLLTRRLINEGTMLWTSTGGVTMGANSIFDNYGTVDLSVDIQVHNAVGGWPTASTVNNYGTIRKKDSPGRFALGTLFNNDGLLAVETGIFEMSIGGTSSGQYQVAEAATLRYADGNHTLEASTSISGAGAVQFNGGTVSLGGAFDISGPVSASLGVVVFGTNSVVAPITNASISHGSGRLEFNSMEPVVIGSLNLVGTLRGTSTVIITNSVNWTDGVMDGKGITRITPGATMTLSTAQGKAIRERVVINEGTGSWSGNSTFTIGASGEFRNLGTFEILNDQSISTAVGGWATVGWFVNEGILRKAAGTGTTEVGSGFRNHGLVEILSGTLRLFGSDTNSGAFFVATNSTLRLTDGSFTFTPAASITGPGTLTVSSGTTAFENSPATRILLTGGTMRFNGGLNNLTRPLVMEGGTIEGTGTMVVRDSLEFRSGTIRGSGSTVIASGATARFVPTNLNRFLNRLMSVEGTLNLEDTVVTHMNGGTLVIAPGGLLSAAGTTAFTWNGGSVAITNQGTILKTGAGTLTFNGSVPLYNAGSMVVASGGVQLTGGGRNSGTIQVNGGTTFNLAAHYSHDAGALLAGAGTIHFSNGNHDILGTFLPEGTVTFGGTGTVTVRNPIPTKANVQVSGGTFRAEAAQTLATVSLNSGTIDGSANLTVTNSLTWLRGFMSGTGRTILPAGARLVIEDPPGAKYLQRSIENSGTITLPVSAQIHMNNGRLFNLAGGRIEVLDGFTFTHSANAAVFDNQGTLLMTGTNLLSFGSAVTVNNAGTAEVRSGSLQISGPGTNSGSLLISSNALATFTATMTHAPGSFLGGLGEIRFTGGTHNLLGSFKPQGVLSFRGGTVTVNEPIRPVEPLIITNSATVHFNVDQTFGDLVLNATAISGSGLLTVTNRLTWQAGDMTGTGRTVVPAGSTLIVEGGFNNKSLGRALDVAGTTHYANGQRIFLQNSVINNLTGAVFNVTGGDLRWNSGSSQVNNHGLWEKTATNLFEVFGLPFNNYGSGQVNVLDGIFSLNGGGTNFGSVHIATNATLLLPSSVWRLGGGTSLTGGGSLIVDGGSTLSLLTNVHFGALKVIVRWAGTIAGAFEMANGPGGTFRFEKNTTVPGSLRVGGSLEVGTNVSLVINGNLQLEAGSTLTNYGQIQVKGVYTDGGATIVGNAPIQLGPVPAPRLTLVGFTSNARQDAGAMATVTVSRQFVQGQSTEVILTWTAQPGTRFTVQSSADLARWTDCAAVIQEVSPGKYEARAPVSATQSLFFRTRQQ